ncbi:S-adenosyl-L-methionine-dependent methyltransferases superfamily [Olea europaea subsp. europaea]|uniref:S-adenosyl-L-methionine-dependent methyltransferases superfamily n=1 Tax=Olea europaea subsp. europaea TaxID=158383 RepID=A0A8S0S1Q5_OLEEU|nr:S-adenosyl-L-methionine-dependent methyltransferases superfamily [Olea europaea subsp. europaea]
MSSSWGAVHRWVKPLPSIAFRPSGRLLPTIQSTSPFVISGAASYSKWAFKSVADADQVVVAADGNYGSKQVISVTPRLYDYLLANVREPQILRELREETATMRGSQMQVSPDQAQLLAMLVQILGAQRCIEVGVYTGYSSLAIALVLPEGGCLVACERDAISLEVAKRYYDRAGVSHKIDVKHGLAADTLKSMLHNGEDCSYDFAFVDAEKRMYSDYFELLLQLVRVGGIIVIDNVLWHGKVADPLVNDPKTDSIRNFNKKLMDDERVSISMVPIGDGMTICRKR